MRLLTSLTAAMVLSVGAAAAGEFIEVEPAIPHGIAVTLWMPRFPDAHARRQADKAARESCRAAGGKARFIRSALLQRTETHGQEGTYLYDCRP